MHSDSEVDECGNDEVGDSKGLCEGVCRKEPWENDGSCDDAAYALLHTNFNAATETFSI